MGCASPGTPYLPNTIYKVVHALIDQVPVGLPGAKALFFEHGSKRQELLGDHLKRGIVEEDHLQQHRLLTKALHKPARNLPLRLWKKQGSKDY